MLADHRECVFCALIACSELALVASAFDLDSKSILRLVPMAITFSIAFRVALEVAAEYIVERIRGGHEEDGRWLREESQGQLFNRGGGTVRRRSG